VIPALDEKRRGELLHGIATEEVERARARSAPRSTTEPDLDREDGSFHEDTRDVFHLGFERSELQTLLAAAGFVGLEVTTATITRKENRDYPVFLITGRRPG
jgi:hypothetical protein